MGNKLGGQKSPKPKEENRREKETVTKREKEVEKNKKKTLKKEKKEIKSKKKEKAKKPDGKFKLFSGREGRVNSGSEFETDLESSHMAGWDSESGVFHSAENISTSPYLDSHTRSELEHSGTWSAVYESSSASRYPQVLSSRDFRDGFSLEACIPPEIARRDTNYYDHDGGGGGGGGSSSNVFSYSTSSSLKSKRSNSSKSSRMTPTSGRYRADDRMSVSTSSSQKSGPMGREGYSTPLLTTPVFGRVDRTHSSTGPGGSTAPLARVHELDRDSMDIVSLSKSPYDPNAKIYTSYNPPVHLAHLYQHQAQPIDYRNLPKPTSPYPQRRALSPKMTSPPFKLISSDDSSSSPSTPVPQRKASNILADLLRSGRGSGDKKKQQKNKGAGTSESDENGTLTYSFRQGLAQEGERKKSKGLSMWKTWERSSKKKSEKSSKTSIFGTSRKTNKKKMEKNDSSKEGDGILKETDRMSDSTLKDLKMATIETTVDPHSENTAKYGSKVPKSSTSSYENSSSMGASDVDYWVDPNRNSSPPVAKSAAFCIMRLEELERNIEKTIREKFPDAEPFLIRKRTPPDDSSRGSKSLPTTPSPKKKILVNHDVIDTSQKEIVTSTLEAASTKLGVAAAVGSTRYYDETFEESASPVMSPVVLRRFGARTRHASISPKIQRAKTAAVYNSPSEMDRVPECVTPIGPDSPPNESTKHNQATTTLTHSTLSKTSNQPFQSQGHHNLIRQQRVERSESEEDNHLQRYPAASINPDTATQSVKPRSVKLVKSNEKSGVDTHSFDKPVIVPSVSAVFGSVSPKLKRHLQTKLDNQYKSRKAHSADQKDDKAQQHGGDDKRWESFDSALKSSSKNSEQKETQELVSISKGQDITSATSAVQSRVANIIKTISEGWAGGGEGSGGYPFHPHARASAQTRAAEAGVSAFASHSPLSPVVWPNSRSHLCSADTVKQDGEAKTAAQKSPVTSPGTGRKHSTDHVIFGSAVALPCRVYSPPSSPERRNRITNYNTNRNNNNDNNKNNTSSVSHFHSSSTCAHAQSSSHTGQEFQEKKKNVKRGEGQTGVSANTPSSTAQRELIVSSCKESTSLSDSLGESNRDAGVCSRHTAPSVSANSSDNGSKSQGVFTGNRRYILIPDTNVNTLSIPDDDSLKPSTSSPLKSLSVDTNYASYGYSDTSKDYPSASHQVGQGECDEIRLSNEHPVFVHKLPVSRVISDMINSSKQQQEQTRNWQAIPTSPDKDAMRVEPAVAMVTTPFFQQACLSLEEKCVISSTTCNPLSPSVARVTKDTHTHLAEQECSQHEEAIQSSNMGVNKDLDHSLTKSSDTSPIPTATGNSSETSEESDFDSFLKSVIASEKLPLPTKASQEIPCESSAVEGVKQNPPPPSPTAEQKISEILEEEEEGEEEDNEVKEMDEKWKEEAEKEEEACGGEDAARPRNESKQMVNLALVRHNEMRVFSDEVCQRLSALLSSHTGSDEVFVGTDWKEDEDEDYENKGDDNTELTQEEEEEEEEEEEGEVFLANDQTVHKGHVIYGNDLHKHWEDPGLLSEPSEDQTIERNNINLLNAVNDPTGEIRPSTFSTSSSLSTSSSSSSSSSELFAPPSLPPSGKRNVEVTAKRRAEQDYFTYRKQKDDDEYFDQEARNRRDVHSRCYHSDDDVTRGGGIPEYYDDRPLWKKRQKPPGQMSIALAAIRRRERRERWLKKRRRNRTDLLSTGSSDNMGSETSLRQGSRLSFGDSTGSCENEENEEITHALYSHRRAMGSGILTSPKYSKPIMPFMGSGDIAHKNQTEADEEIITPESAAPRLSASFLGDGFYSNIGDITADSSGDRDSSMTSRSTDRTVCEDPNQSFDTMDELDDTSTDKTTATTVSTFTPGSNSQLAIPGLEETFDELESVKQMLEELQERTPIYGASASKMNLSSSSSHQHHSDRVKLPGKLMPLTVENIKSIKELYKDSNNGRRSRLSNTDRTESDLDLFSEYRDDVSTDSNLYADDEDDDDNNEPYATADDDVGGATGGHEDENFVVSCTFYNSKAVSLDCANGNTRREIGPCPEVTSEGNRLLVPSGRSYGQDAEISSILFTNSSNNTNNNANNDAYSIRDGDGSILIARSSGANYGRSNSAPGSRSGNQFSLARGVSTAGMSNSDDEFWAGRAAFERSYQQLESATGAVSSTFQNAREQMMDIQQHLQALRRQMEGLQDDLNSTSYTLTPEHSTFDSK